MNYIKEMLDFGWVLFPLAEGSKQPPQGRTGHLSWTQADSYDFIDELQPPNNVGILTGKSSGIVAIDIDPKHDASLETLWEILGEEVWTRIHRTRSGGWHLIYRYPEGVERVANSVGMLAPGIDVRGDGGYIVGPGSVIDGQTYTVDRDDTIAELPPQLLNKLLPAQRDVPEFHYQYPSDQWDDVKRWHRMNVREAADAGDGERDDTVYRMLVRSFQLAMCVPDDVLSQDSIVEDFVRKCPYTIKQLSGKAERAWKFAEVTPRPHPQPLASPLSTEVSKNGGPPVISESEYKPDSLLNPASFNDAGNAERLAELYGDRLRYVEGLGWLIWDGKVWQTEQDSSASVIEMIQHAHALFWQDYNAKVAAEEQGAKALWAHAQYSLSMKGIMNAMNLLKNRHSIRISVDELDSHNHLLCVRNGVVDLRTGMLYAHDPELHMTQMIDIDYHIDAEAPRWLQFMDEVMPEMPDMPPFMQRLVGYGITGETSEHCLAIHYGRGSNGKSIFLDTLRSVFRSVSVVADWSSFERKQNGAGGPRPDLVRLRGARLVTVNEADARASIDEAQIKRMASGDAITARGLHQNDIEFTPNFLIQMATNAKPDIVGADEGIWRRVKLIPWTRYFAPHERDHGLAQTLLEEREGILAWAVRGAVEWYATGLQEPERVRAATNDYRESTDILGGFIDAAEHGGWLVPEENKRVPSAWAYTLYQKWATTQGYRERDMLKQKTFKAAMEERGYNTKRTNKGTMFIGLAANTQVAAVRTHTTENGAKPDYSTGSSLAEVVQF